MYYMKNGLKNKKMASILAPAFAICGALATLFGTGNMMQANQMTLSFNSQFGIPKLASAIVITFFVAVVIIGGIKRIGAVAEHPRPGHDLHVFRRRDFVILSNVSVLPSVFALIFKHAFTPYAAAGGAIGYTVKSALQFGFRRGLLTNEAGLGSAPIAHAAAQTKSPVHQGVLGIAEVFVDTILVCSFTAIINLSTGLWDKGLNGTDIDGRVLQVGGRVRRQRHGRPGLLLLRLHHPDRLVLLRRAVHEVPVRDQGDAALPAGLRRPVLHRGARSPWSSSFTSGTSPTP